MKISYLSFTVLTYISIANLHLQAESYEPFAHLATTTRSITTQSKPRKTITLSSEVSGKISAIYVDLGQLIEKPLVFELDPIRAKILLDQVEQSQKSSEEQEKLYKNAHGQLIDQKEFQTKEIDRSRQLTLKGGAPQQELDAQEQKLAQLQFSIQEQSHRIQLQRILTEKLKLDLLLQKDSINRHQGFAPVGWTVIARHKEPGEITQVGEPILSCVDLRSLIVEAYLDEVEIEAIPTAKGYWTRSQTPCSLKIFYISPVVESNTRKRQVQWIIPETQASYCGKEITLKLEWKNIKEGYFIPNAYVTESFGQKFVTNSESKLIPIKTIRHEDQGWVVSQDTFKKGELIFIPLEKSIQISQP